MKQTQLTVVAIAATLAATPVLGGTAQAFGTFGTLTVNYGDTYKISCTSTATHCIAMHICDANPDADIFQQVLAATSPSTLVGKTQNDIAVNGGCAGTIAQTICRSGTAVGPMKGLAVITHPSGTSGDQYNVEIECLDKTSNPLPEATLKVTQTENNN